jgi:hypothetical protein
MAAPNNVNDVFGWLDERLGAASRRVESEVRGR